MFTTLNNKFYSYNSCDTCNNPTAQKSLTDSLCSFFFLTGHVTIYDKIITTAKETQKDKSSANS